MLTRWKSAYTPWTILGRRIQLRRILRAVDKQLQTSLTDQVPYMQKPPARQVTITPEEFERLMLYAQPWMRLFLTLTGMMALRFSEARRVGPQHFNAEKQSLTVPTKGGKLREFHVPKQVAELIALAPESQLPTYIERLKGTRIGRDRLRQVWNSLKRKAGVRMEITPHDLRRTACVRIYEITKSVLAAKELLGHDNLSSTALYLQPYDVKAMNEVSHALQTWTPKGERIQ